MAIKRSPHWVTLFHEFLKARHKEPFAWGSNDCALFAADGIKAFTGADIAEDFRGKYSTEAEAWSVVAQVTGVAGGTIADAAAYCATKAGLQELNYPLMAQRGDLVVVENDGRIVFGPAGDAEGGRDRAGEIRFAVHEGCFDFGGDVDDGWHQLVDQVGEALGRVSRLGGSNEGRLNERQAHNGHGHQSGLLRKR